MKFATILLLFAALNATPLFSHAFGTEYNPVQSQSDFLLVQSKDVLPARDTLIKDTALALVQRQLNAYNARNIEAFLEPYSEDVELYSFPDSLISKGKEPMRKRYTGMFSRYTSLHCEIKARIIQEQYIIDKEIISGVSTNTREATVIYYVANNKISKVYFLR